MLCSKQPHFHSIYMPIVPCNTHRGCQTVRCSCVPSLSL
uniref:Uncharacterized protein n=1 Tax=Arundo donax TaxID=35708 RepID=A0A0A9HTF4_ARUDO